MPERFETKRCIKALYKHSSFPFLYYPLCEFIMEPAKTLLHACNALQIENSRQPYLIASSKQFQGLVADKLIVKMTLDNFGYSHYFYDMTVDLCCRQPISTSSALFYFISCLLLSFSVGLFNCFVCIYIYLLYLLLYIC